jgi:hypothetical protein
MERDRYHPVALVPVVPDREASDTNEAIGCHKKITAATHSRKTDYFAVRDYE